MRFATSLLVVLVVGVLLECTEPVSDRRSERSASHLRLAVPDTAYKLSAVERLNVRADFDVDGLEKLLQMLRPESRPEALKALQYSGPSHAVVNLVELDDPVLQAELEKVWAPHWTNYTLEGIRHELAPFPGKSAAELRLTSKR